MEETLEKLSKSTLEIVEWRLTEEAILDLNVSDDHDEEDLDQIWDQAIDLFLDMANDKGYLSALLFTCKAK